MDNFDVVSDVIISEKYYLFSPDILVKFLDEEEFYYDKIIEEWTPSNLFKTYQEKGVKFNEINEEQAKEIIDSIKSKNRTDKKELDFDFIEELVMGKKRLVIVDKETNNTYEVKQIEKNKNNKIVFLIILIIFSFIFIGNIITINHLLNNNNKEINSKVETLTLKNIVIVKGSSLPSEYNNYIKEKLSTETLKQLTINTENVNTEVSGMYSYTIKYKNKEYLGVVIVTNNEKEKNQTIDQLENPEKYSQ